MEKQTTDDLVDDYICMDRAEPKARFLSGGGAFYAALLLAVVGAIMLANALSVKWNWPRAVVQLSLYALLLVLAWLVYRFRLVAFRYILTSKTLRVDRAVGTKLKHEISLRLSDVEYIRPCPEAEARGRRLPLYTGRRREALALGFIADGRARTLVISPSEEFTGKLIEQWKSLNK